jgi:hypothetical protein
VSDPSLAESLLEFLAAKRCVVEPLSETTLDVVLTKLGARTRRFSSLSSACRFGK